MSYDAWKTTDTDTAQRIERDLASEQAMADYVSDWINGTLHDDGETYTAPVLALVEDDVISDLLTAKTDAEIVQAGRIVARLLRANIEKQAGVE